MSWLLKLISDLIGEMLMGFLKLFGGLINNMFETMYTLNQKIDITKVKEYITAFSLAFVAFYAIKQLIDVYALQVNGDPDSDPLELITRVCVSIAVIMSGSYLIDLLVETASVISKDLIGAMGSSSGFTDGVNNIFAQLGTSGLMVLFGTIYCIVVVVYYLIFIFRAAKRGAELILFQLLIPVFACDLITTNRERWNAIFSELMLCIFGYIIQMICMTIFMTLLNASLANGGLQWDIMVVTLSWLILCVNAPKWLSKFTYTSGVGNGAKGAGRSALFMLPQILKK